MKQAAAVLFFLMFSSFAAAEQPCNTTCILPLTGDDSSVIIPVDAPGLWQVSGCEPIYDMTRHDEPIIGWNPQINLFDSTKAHSFPNYVPEIDGNEKVLLGETWVRIDDEKVWNEWFGLHNVEHSPCSFGS